MAANGPWRVCWCLLGPPKHQQTLHGPLAAIESPGTGYSHLLIKDLGRPAHTILIWSEIWCRIQSFCMSFNVSHVQGLLIEPVFGLSCHTSALAECGPFPRLVHLAVLLLGCHTCFGSAAASHVCLKAPQCQLSWLLPMIEGCLVSRYYRRVNIISIHCYKYHT